MHKLDENVCFIGSLPGHLFEGPDQCCRHQDIQSARHDWQPDRWLHRNFLGVWRRGQEQNQKHYNKLRERHKHHQGVCSRGQLQRHRGKELHQTRLLTTVLLSVWSDVLWSSLQSEKIITWHVSVSSVLSHADRTKSRRSHSFVAKQLRTSAELSRYEHLFGIHCKLFVK